MALLPRDLPKLRMQTARNLADPEMPVRKNTGADMQEGLDAAARHLRAADLYWVTPDMSALAVHSGAQLEEARWATADRPSGCGLVLWEGGIGMATVSDPPVDIPVEALTWGPHDGGLLVWCWISRRRLMAELHDEGVRKSGGQRFEIIAEKTPALMPIAGTVLPVDPEPSPITGFGERTPVPDTAVRALAASWLLMEQPKIAGRTVVRPDGPARRSLARAGFADPEVTLVDLRRLRVPQDPENGAGEGRAYRHRWVVSGHWRNAWRPSVGEHRKTWIEAHVKGPDGAPMLARERVNVWRR